MVGSHVQSELFGIPQSGTGDVPDRFQPLAERVRPRTLDDLAGQEHLTGKEGPLRRFIESGKLPSLILWGPPGSGKTTIAEIFAGSLKCRFEQLSAIDTGVKEVRKVLESARQAQRAGFRTLLFIDEIHRFNKAQQDTLLHAIEQGSVILIGATTENPSFEVNAALLSRMQVYVLKPLQARDVEAVLRRALKHDRVLKERNVTLEGLDFLLQFAGGDARKALNALEAAILLVPGEERNVTLTRSMFERALQHKVPSYDKGAEAHYNTVSAFIKSMRGSDPDAALFWLARMLEGGEDPVFIARRMVIFASEDIGNADPFALSLAVSVFQAAQMIGLPEARINLAQGVTYLAGAPKSNASYQALNEAISLVREFQDSAVPLHLCNAPTSFMKEVGYGEGYRYPHHYPGHFVEERYFPDGMPEQLFYRPTEEGREKQIAERLSRLWKARYRR